MIFNVSILKNEKWFAREQITLQVSFYLGSLLWKNVNRNTTHPTYTLCRLQKTQNLKFLQNLAGFWIFEFSMGISQTWYFNKYIHRINVAFVNRDIEIHKTSNLYFFGFYAFYFSKMQSSGQLCISVKINAWKLFFGGLKSYPVFILTIMRPSYHDSDRL